MRFEQHYTGSFYSPFEMSNFPFDQQVLLIKLESFLFNSSIVQFYFPESFAAKVIPEDLILQEWELMNPFIKVRIYSYWREIAKTYHSRFIIGVVVSRIAQFYQTRIVLTLLFLAIMALLTFYLISAASDRLMGTLLIFWVLVQILFLIGDSLPKLSYFTRIDTFLNQAMYLCAFTFFAHSILYLMRHHWHLIFINEAVDLDHKGDKRIDKIQKKRQNLRKKELVKEKNELIKNNSKRVSVIKKNNFLENNETFKSEVDADHFISSPSKRVSVIPRNNLFIPSSKNVSSSNSQEVELMRVQSLEIENIDNQNNSLVFSNFKPKELSKISNSLDIPTPLDNGKKLSSVRKANIFDNYNPASKYSINDSQNREENIDIDYINWIVTGFNSIRITRRVDIILVISGIVLFFMLVGYHYLEDLPTFDIDSKLN